MDDLIDRLKPEVLSHDATTTVYDLAHIKATARRCIDLDPGLLAVDDDDGHVSFVVFEFNSGPSTRAGVEVDGVKMERVLHGRGFSGALRELRHTYWGESSNAGYIYYLNGKLIANALAALREWFDLD